MNLRDHPFRIYYGPADDPLANFYIPALSASVRYDRSAGFFSSVRTGRRGGESRTSRVSSLAPRRRRWRTCGWRSSMIWLRRWRKNLVTGLCTDGVEGSIGRSGRGRRRVVRHRCA